MSINWDPQAGGSQSGDFEAGHDSLFMSTCYSVENDLGQHEWETVGWEDHQDHSWLHEGRTFGDVTRSSIKMGQIFAWIM